MKLLTLKRFSRCLLLPLWVLAASAVQAAPAWPTHPIRLIVPFEPGAGTDAIQRFFAEKLSAALNVSIVVENIGGAGGAVGAARVANAAPDGYTLLGTIITSVAALPHITHVGYDPIAAFTPIYRIGYPITLMGANPNNGIDSLRTLIDRARSKPGTITYGSAGIGTAPQFRFAALEAATGIKLNHVPYKGGTAYVSDLLAGRIQLFADGPIGGQFGKSGQVKLLAVIDDQRTPAFPNVPTVNEIVPNYKIPATWYLIEGPAKLPPAIRERIAGALAKIAAQPDTATFMHNVWARPSTDAADFDLNAEVKATYASYGEMISRLHISAP